MLQIGAALYYYKLGQTFLQIGVASLLRIRASFVTNWGSYYKLGQPLLQNRAAITNWRTKNRINGFMIFNDIFMSLNSLNISFIQTSS